jgi:hypothetical protein
VVILVFWSYGKKSSCTRKERVKRVKQQVARNRTGPTKKEEDISAPPAKGYLWKWI